MTSPPSLPPSEAQYDTSDWPIFLVTSPRAVLSLEETVAHMRCVTEIGFARGEPFVLLFDARNAPRHNAAQRRIVADEMKRSQRLFPGLALGVGIVLRSSLDRGIVTAINWLAGPPYPIGVFESVIKAKVWARALLAEVIVTSSSNTPGRGAPEQSRPSR
jgi:hypothetical protein